MIFLTYIFQGSWKHIKLENLWSSYFMTALGQKYYVSGYQTMAAKKYWPYTFFHKDVQKNLKDL